MKTALLFLKCMPSLSLSLSLAVASEPSMYSCCVNHITTFFSRMLTCSCWTQKPQRLTSWLLSSEIPFFLSHLWSTMNTQKGLDVPPLLWCYLMWLWKNWFRSKQKLEQEETIIFDSVQVLSSFWLKMTSSSFEK